METTEKQFAQIVRENRSTIYTVCYMFSKDADEVSDLFQEVLINLWKGFAAFEGKSDIRTWIYRVSLNTCISVDRKKKRHKTVPLSMSINLFEDNDADTRQVQLLYKRINRLGPFDKALVLLWLENLSAAYTGQAAFLTGESFAINQSRSADGDVFQTDSPNK